MSCPDTVSYDWVTATLYDHKWRTLLTMPRVCVTSTAWTQFTFGLEPNNIYTLTLISHDDNQVTNPSYTLFDNVFFYNENPTAAPSTPTVIPTYFPSVVPSIVPPLFIFSYTGAVQTWRVPESVYRIYVDVSGAQGGIGCPASQGCGGWTRGGLGGRVTTNIKVTPGQTLYIYVGGVGSDNDGHYPNAGRWNGGGRGGSGPPFKGGDGGGASDIRTSSALSSRIVVAGGGGGTAPDMSGAAGGGLIGQNTGIAKDSNGYPCFERYALGGGQSAPTSGQSKGSLGQGANGMWCYTAAGGGGGGGYYGGNGGSGNVAGAGGSSFTNSSLCDNVVHSQGVRSGDGIVYIIISTYSPTVVPITSAPSTPSLVPTLLPSMAPTSNSSFKFLRYTGAVQTLIVPQFIYEMHVDMYGCNEFLHVCMVPQACTCIHV